MSSSATFVNSTAVTALRPSVGLNASTCSLFRGQPLISTQTIEPERDLNTTKHDRQGIVMRRGRYQGPGVPRPGSSPQQQMQQQMKPPEDGTPLFALFVRTSRTKIWYPLGAVKGDDRSKNLVNAFKGGIARGMYQQALDRGMAQTLYGKDSQRFLDGTFRAYPQLKKHSSMLEFGYRVAATGLDEQPIRVVTKDMALGMFAAIRKAIGDWFSNLKGSK